MAAILRKIAVRNYGNNIWCQLGNPLVCDESLLSNLKKVIIVILLAITIFHLHTFGMIGVV